MARDIGASQYLTFGVLWVGVGAWIVGSEVVNRSLLDGSAVLSSGLAVLLFGAGGYWLWRYPKVRRKEVEASPFPVETK